MNEVLESAKKLLVEIDEKIDQMEGENIHKAMLDVQFLLLEWNNIGTNFVTSGLQDWTGVEQ